MLDPANPWKLKKKTEGRTSMFIKKQEPSEMFLFDPDRGNESKMERLIREMSEDFICSKLAPWKICTRFIMRKGKFFCSDVRGLLGWDTQKCWISRLEAMQACFIDCLKKKTEGKDFYKSGTQYNVYNMYMHHPHSGIVGSSKNAISLIIAAFTLFPILQLFFRYGICRPA